LETVEEQGWRWWRVMSQFKIECARRQLGTALDLYLRDLDPVSVHCLANGGCELIEFQAKKAGAEPLMSHILTTQPHRTIEEVRTLQRQYWNAFKHALTHGGGEREDDDLLSRFTDLENDAALFVGWVDYGRATKTMPIEAQVHHMWWITLNPDKIDPKHPIDPSEYDRRFPGLREMKRVEQKRMLNRVIEEARTNRELMDHPRTDPRPLVLDWKHRPTG
jgi:hypothetical protein